MEVLQKFKQRKFYTYRVSCLLSCLLLVLSSGFLSVSAYSNYKYYSGTVERMTGVYTHEDFVYYQGKADSGYMAFNLEDGFLTSGYNRLVVTVWSSSPVPPSEFTFFPSSCDIYSGTHTSVTHLGSGVSYHYDNVSTENNVLGYVSFFDLSSLGDVSISRIAFSGSGNYSDYYVSFFMYNDTGSNDISALISSIQQQTSQLMQKPDTEQFSSDKINGQVDSIQDKMGVLSFGETVLSDFVDLWSVTGSTELTLPAFTINVANVDYQVWGNQTFDLSRLDGWFGSFMSVVRRVLSCIVWLACLNYIIKQFEEFFSNG